MAPKFIFSLTITFLLLPFFISADTPPSTPTTPGNVCDTAPDPKFCKAVLPNHNASVYDSGRYSFRKSISQTRKFLNIVDKYLARRSSLSKIAVRALEDCRFLASLSMDYLSTSFSTVNVSNNTLSTMKADDVQSFLSASLTNQQTCLEGLQTASTVNNDLANPLVNDTKLYSVSLALFTKGWVPKTKKWKPKRKQRAFSGGKLPLKFSNKASNVFESLKGRKTLETVTEVNAVTVSDIVIVNQTGSGDFITINDAVAAAPNNTDGSNGYFMIYIAAGVYEEYVSIPKNKKYLMMVGDGINQTVITGNRSVVDGWTTFNSATFAVTAPNFIAVNITIRNTAGAIKHQAVALRSGADLSTFYSCSFEGYQDTLYTHSLRQFYSECDIYGTVDFIFGNAAVVFQNCNLYPRLPMRGQFNAITAQGRTDPNQNTGISIHNCKIRAADDLASSNMTVRTFLGRPWKEYSRTVYMQTFMDSLIQPAGWQIWSGDFALKTLYYAEYNNTGLGSDTSNRVTWEGYHIINATDAANYTVSGFLLGQDWIPQTGVPFNSDLL